MRIVHLNTESGIRGGERQIMLLVRGLADRGHEQLIIGRDKSELIDILRAEGFQTAELPAPGMLGVHNPALVRLVRDIADSFRTDIAHAHASNAHSLAVRAFLGRLPLLTTRRVDFAIKKGISGRKYRQPNQHFIAISNGVRRVLEEGGVPPERIDVVFSGIDAGRVRGGDGRIPRGEWLDGDAGPLIGFVGALVDHKAPWILAEALPAIRRELPGARIVYIGEGEERPRLEALRSTLPGAIVLAGWRGDIADCLAALDLFVMPSRLEGLCTSLVDALAAGIPAVASSTGGIPDVIEDGVTGDLVPPLDTDALATAVVKLWKDSDRRARYIEAGKRRVEERFTADAMVAGTEAVYRRVLEKHRRGGA